MLDQITEIDLRDLPLLRDLFATAACYSSKNYSAYITIDTYIRWFQQDPMVKYVTFYCLNGDFSRGTFIVIDDLVVAVFTLHKSTDELCRLLSLLDYSNKYLFVSFNEDVNSAIKSTIETKNVEIVRDYPLLHYWLPKEKALKLDLQIPDGIELRPVTKPSDIEKVYSEWSLSDRFPIDLLVRVAKYNPNIGAFTNDGTLVAWVFRHTTGLIMALGTDPNHQRKGYGSLVVKAISKMITELGHEPCVTVWHKNKASSALFERHGFKKIEQVHWIGIKPACLSK